MTNGTSKSPEDPRLLILTTADASRDRRVFALRGRSAAALVGLTVFLTSALWAITRTSSHSIVALSEPIAGPKLVKVESASLSVRSDEPGETPKANVQGPALPKRSSAKARTERTVASQAANPPRKIAESEQPDPIVADPPSPVALDDRQARESSRRALVADESGRAVVARVLEGPEGKPFALLPDGRLGRLDRVVETDQPFRPASFEEIEKELRAGEFKGFQAIQGKYYLVLYNGTRDFAEKSVALLDSLYQGLCKSFRKNGIDVRETEFPLAAIIYRDESEFRARRAIEPEIQAYYEILTNRIYLFEKSERDREAPEVAALRKPQTLAHEGVHQIVQNIGVQPRLAPWPIWLVEGLAEYCATTGRARGSWERLGMVNPFHMATIADLGANPRRSGRSGRRSTIDDLIAKTELTPTDYALSWALTHYLALKRGEEFAAYLRTLGKLSPADVRTPEDHRAEFRRAFKISPALLDKKVAAHLHGLKYEKIPYYAVTLERVVPNGLITRTGLVSQSPSLIREWIDETVNRAPGVATWRIFPFADRQEAVLLMRGWVEGQ